MLTTLRAYARGPVLTAPGPRSAEMIRSIGAIRRDPLAFLAASHRAHGPVVQFPVPVPPAYSVADAAVARKVLVENARNYDKQTMQYRGLSVLTGEGLLTADGDVWRSARRTVQPAFHHELVAQMRGAVVTAVDAACDRWRTVPAVDIEAEMMRIALEIVGTTLFSADLSAEAADLSAATMRALDAVVSRAQRPWAASMRIPTPANRVLRSSLASLDAAVESLITHRLRNPVRETDMLALLMQAHNVTDGRAVPRPVRDEIVTFIVAGHETVASGLTWAWHLLLSHPERHRRLLDCTADPAEARAYARAVFEEALRLYPPAWLITRRSIEPDTLGGHAVPGAALVIISPWVIHRDPQWWPEPEVFNPERFLREDDARRLAYLPFGIGQRMCIGREMALLEGAVALARIAERMELTLVGGESVGRIASVTLRPATHITAVARPR